MSWVADENATTTAVTANATTAEDGSIDDNANRLPPIASCDSSNQARRRPSIAVSSGSFSRSTSGDHRNLNT